MDRQETVGRGKRWEATSTPLQWYDPEPLPSVPGTPQVGRDFYLDEPCTARGFVSVAPTSLAWKDRAGKFDIKLTQGVATSLHAQYSWTVPSGAWTHRRALFRGDPEELVRLFHRDRVRQERLEKVGHRSPKWEVLRSLQQVYGQERSEAALSSTLLPSLNRRDERRGNHGRKWTGKSRGIHHPETVRKRRLQSQSGSMMKGRW